MKKSSKNKRKLRLVIEGCIILLLIIVFFVVNKKIDKENEKRVTDGYKYYIDSLLYDEDTNEISIIGWFFIEGLPCPDAASRDNFKVLLAKDGKRDEMLEIPVTPSERLNVTKTYGGGAVDYNYCGFIGSLKVDESIKQNKYRVLFQYDANEEKYYYTICYLENGEFKKEQSQWDLN